MVANTNSQYKEDVSFDRGSPQETWFLSKTKNRSKAPKFR